MNFRKISKAHGTAEARRGATSLSFLRWTAWVSVSLSTHLFVLASINGERSEPITVSLQQAQQVIEARIVQPKPEPEPVAPPEPVTPVEQILSTEKSSVVQKSFETKPVKVEKETPPPPEPVEETQTVENPPPEPQPMVEKKPVKETQPTPEPTVAEAEKPSDVSRAQQMSGALTDWKPQAIVCPNPHYPRLAQRRGIEGAVGLLVSTDPHGNPTSVRIEESSGFDMLDDEARDTVLHRWQFEAGPQGAKDFTVVVTFRLEG